MTPATIQPIWEESRLSVTPQAHRPRTNSNTGSPQSGAGRLLRGAESARGGACCELRSEDGVEVRLAEDAAPPGCVQSDLRISRVFDRAD